MKISGVSFVRNALKLSYPIIESLTSLIPVCDEVIVAVGNSDDGTLEAVRGLSPKIRVIETIWDDAKREGGRILAEQTNIALNEAVGDWCLYLQADEVLHEDDLEKIKPEMIKAENRDIEALIFRYRHFYGSYDYIGTGRQWYRREIRAFKNTGKVVSWGDAQGFKKRVGNDFEKLRARQTELRIFHYGWVRPPKAQQLKQQAFQRLYHDDTWMAENVLKQDEFDYDSAFELEFFKGTHPRVMHDRIEKDREWTQRFDQKRLKKKPLLVKLTDGIEKRTGWRIGEYKNFTEVK
ncbi:MAG TPA: glycosyltransferase [Patescibacteria group bacterium]|nr:glycosyltransferase [Patescibacteria group bacterium]